MASLNSTKQAPRFDYRKDEPNVAAVSVYATSAPAFGHTRRARRHGPMGIHQ